MKKEMIHPPYNRFKGFARENGVTYADLGRLLGLTPSTICQKVNGYSDFYLSEQKLLKQEFGITDEIFL